MNFNFRLSSAVLLLMLCCFLFPLLSTLHVPLLGGLTVTIIESVQAFMLLFFAVFTYLYTKPLHLPPKQKMFWLWAVCWWLLLFGRSTSWGRDYFPELPKVYFRGISVVMIAPVVFMLFSKNLRQAIVDQFKQLQLLFWPLCLVIVGLLASDAVEHHRAYAWLFLWDVHYQDLIEEMYEFPLILGLFALAYGVMQQDPQQFKLQGKSQPAQAEHGDLQSSI